ncbi:unnamed protein product [Owenia fusiformis]|uniref:Uncharacterized protein n=1 Tax=Owenia fusiformis TaxID=6347 RepID=A0A8J1XY83_OWEFU|nr:unnamed protein product [Owenia fusiformis]
MTDIDEKSLLENVFNYTNLVHAISGAVGSGFALTVFYPLDTVRTRLQVDDHRKPKHLHEILREIFTEEGLLSLYRGLYPVVASLCCSNFVYFYTFNGLKVVNMANTGTSGPAKDLLMAFIAGCINVLVTTPLWVVNTRIKLQGVQFKTETHQEKKVPKYTGLIDGLMRIWREEGIRSLWSGTLPSLVLVSNPSVQFMVYESLKRYLQRMSGVEELSGLTYFLLGAIAKMCATFLTYPMQVIQSRLRAGYHKKELADLNFIQQLRNMIRNNGVLMLYKGLEAKLYQTVLTAALMFLTYEKISHFIFRLMGIELKAT